MQNERRSVMGRCLDNPCLQCCIRVVRWVPVVFIVAVLGWAYYAFVFQLCFFTVTNAAERALYLVIFHVLMFLFLFSYYRTVFTEIARPPPAFHLSVEVRRELESADDDAEFRQILERYVHLQQLPVTNRGYDGGIRFCTKCACVKPDRSHHCSVCGHCVLKFDHHCPWVNTCVNFGNYKYFVQFLGYALLFCLFGVLTLLQYFIDFWQGDSRVNSTPGRFHILFLFFVAAMFAISVSCLFFYHLYLTSRNQSTIESFRPPVFSWGPDKNGYNLGIKRNYAQVFGSSRLLWFLPVFSSLGDGVQYPINRRDSGDPQHSAEHYRHCSVHPGSEMV